MIEYVGTPVYRAPEQEIIGGNYDNKVDLFAVGILTFEMWCPPFVTAMERGETLRLLREVFACT